ncbi:hypothetical protein [uncultured Sphingomonas sp.]|uniref:hypothetical protein n=1 Tax=uncultured Sphingomonas sp. TaxID=158754 RepID=UPI0035CA150A
MQDFEPYIRWFAAISGMIAAALVSLDWGRRDTGWAMVLFCLSAVAWITGAALMRDWALGTQNVVLLGIDALGVYRYLIRDPDADERG